MPTSTNCRRRFGKPATPDSDRAAEFLLAAGAHLNWIRDYAQGTPLDAAQQLGTQQQNVISWLRERAARTADQVQ